MKRRWKLWLSLVLLTGGLVALPAMHWRVIGWVRGEAFYQGMPASWWAREIRGTYLPALRGARPGPTEWWVATRSSLWDQLYQRFTPRAGVPAFPVMDAVTGSPLLDGDPAALPLLLSLVHDRDAMIRSVAICGLLAQGTRPEVLQPSKPAA